MKKINSFIVLAMLVTCYPMVKTSSEGENTRQQQYHKILVLALSETQDSTLTQNMEEHMRANLEELGYTAISATSQYGYDAFKNIMEEETLKQLYTYDAVITLTLLNGTKEKCLPLSVSNTFFWNYYADMYTHVNMPGYYTEKGKYYWEANFYDLYCWQLKYSMHTQPFDPKLTQSLIPEYGKLIVTDMTNNVLQKKEGNLKAF